MTLNEYLRYQRQALVDEMRGGWADPSFMTLPKSRLDQLHASGAVKVRHLNEPSTDSLVLSFAERHPQLWVESGHSPYRKAFQTYLEQEFKVAERIPPALHVDHLDPGFKFSSCIDDVYVRLVLVPGSVNIRYGAGFERQSNQYSKTLSRPSGHNLTYTAFFKAVGHNVPLRSEGREAWDRWVESCIELLLADQVIDKTEIAITKTALNGEVQFRFRESNITKL